MEELRSSRNAARFGLRAMRSGRLRFALWLCAGVAAVSLLRLVGATDALADVCSSCNQHPAQPCPRPIDFTVSVFPSVIVGSPYGPLVGSSPATIQFNKVVTINGVPTTVHSDQGVEVWLETSPHTSLAHFLLNPSFCSRCIVDYAYDETLTDANGQATFSPAFSGAGSFSYEYEWDCPEDPSGCAGIGYYGPGGGSAARSTDMVGAPNSSVPDGDTDQDDKINLGLLLKNGTASLDYDYNVDGVVDAADYLLLTNEYLRESGALTSCEGDGGGTFVQDTSAPGAVTLSLSGSGTSVTLSWTSPGNDTYNGDQLGVAKEFILRGSASPITSSNFDQATLVTGLPDPGLPGTSRQKTINACSLGLKYFALKTKDHSNNVSAMSNVVSVPPLGITDLTGTMNCTSVDLQWTSPGSGCSIGAATAYDLRKSTSVITTANFNSATQIWTGAPSPPGSQETVHDDLGACSGRWYFAVKALDGAGSASALSNSFFGSTPCRPCEDGARPRTDVPFALAAPTPSPARERADIKFSVPLHRESEPFELAVFDASGRKVRSLAEGAAHSGASVVSWDLTTDGGERTRSGVYFLRLRLGGDTKTRPMLILD